MTWYYFYLWDAGSGPAFIKVCACLGLLAGEHVVDSDGVVQ